jgi:hypothetical protein
MNKQSMQSSVFTKALHVDSTARECIHSQSAAHVFYDIPTLKDLAAGPHFAVSDKHGCRARRTQKFVLRQASRREGSRSLLIGC